MQYTGTQNSDLDYLLVIDRLGLLKFLARAQCAPRTEVFEGIWNWAEWESEITMILPLKNNSYQMVWAVFGRRIVINCKAETLPFTKSALGEKDENEVEDNGDNGDEDDSSEDEESPHFGERLVVLDFGS
jgi:hypothetical protein